MEAGKRSLWWSRLGCAAVSITVLWVVFHRLNAEALGYALRGTRWGWFGAALGLYGLVFVPGAWRWHLALRETGVAVHPGATARLALIGHFFYTIFFGAVGGDAAKSALYARWYGFPMAQVAAAAPLDRLMGFAGLMLVGMLTLTIALVTRGFDGLKLISVRWPGPWVLLMLALVGGLLLVVRRSRAQSVWEQFCSTFIAGGKRLLRQPRVAGSGALCGSFVQLALSGALAFNLEAVNHGHLDWGRMCWVFPVITLVSGLPISVAGLGTREGAAMILLGLYGISTSEAIAASLLTLAASLAWTAAGGLLLWREGRRQRGQRPMPKSISAIIPTLNEAVDLAETVRRARAVPEIKEIIVADGGSRDQTREIAAQLGCLVVSSAPGRGGQMRCGAEKAKGDVILLLHADTWLPANSGKAILGCFKDASVVGGGCWKIFRDGGPLLRGSRLKCALRLYFGGRIMGDQAMFIGRTALEGIGGVPDMSLMEEFELCRRLRKVGRLALADAVVLTSARRFAKLGVLRTYARMLWVTLRYWTGTSVHELRQIYEKDS